VEPDSAPWPSEAVPDISDGPKPAKKERAAAARPAPAPPLKPGPKSVPEPEPEPVQQAAEPEPAPETAEQPLEASSAESELEPVTPLEAEVEAALGGEEPEQFLFIEELSPEDDPLADIIAGQEAKDEDEDQPGSDRRGTGRSRDHQARRLRLDYFGRLLGARLVDFSTNGLGVEALSPLPVGAEIGISGEIISESGTVGIEGRAKVEHCRSTQDGVCRIGFSLDKAVISDLEDPESFDRR
jgi:hypothetical protein